MARKKPDPGIGHNSGEGAPAVSLTSDGVDRLKQIVAQLETLDEERKDLAGHVKDIYTVAKAAGYDAKVIRAVLKLRKQDRQEREEFDLILGTYLLALGEIA